MKKYENAHSDAIVISSVLTIDSDGVRLKRRDKKKKRGSKENGGGTGADALFALKNLELESF